MTAMDIELDPPHGITGFPLGMPAAEVKAGAAALGGLQVQDDGVADQFRYMKVVALHPQFEITFHLEDGKTLTSAEVWHPRPGPEEITVRFRGTDVFRTPATAFFDLLEAGGQTVLREGDYAYAPGLPLGFTRTAGHEVPLDPDGETTYFEAVMVGPTGYYDYKLGSSSDD